MSLTLLYKKSQICVDLIKQNFKNIIANLPSKPVPTSHVEKHQILELFGIAGTAFGIANSFAISHINSQPSKEIHRTDMLVDITQIIIRVKIINNNQK